MYMTSCRWKCEPLSKIVEEFPADYAAWLHPDETVECSMWRNHGRKNAWLASRWLAKRLLAELGHGQPARKRELAVLSQDERGAGSAPRATAHGEDLPVSLSISHSAEMVLVAAVNRMNQSIGCDITPEHPYAESFMETWFTIGERDLVERHGLLTAPRIWAAKEAAYKAHRNLNGFRPVDFEVSDDYQDDGNLFFVVCRTDGREFAIHSWRLNGHVIALAVNAKTESCGRGRLHREVCHVS